MCISNTHIYFTQTYITHTCTHIRHIVNHALRKIQRPNPQIKTIPVLFYLFAFSFCVLEVGLTCKYMCRCFYLSLCLEARGALSVGGPDLLSSIILCLPNQVSHWTWAWAGGQWVPVILLYLPPTAFQVHVLLPVSLDECWDPDSCLHPVPQEFLPTESSPHSLAFTLITVFEPNLLLPFEHQFIPFNECVHKCTHLEGKGQPWMPFLKHCWLQFLRQCFGTYWTS